MRMKKMTKEELAVMDADSDRCAAEMSDARVDVTRTAGEMPTRQTNQAPQIESG
jgi:maleate cis-trans isomerase